MILRDRYGFHSFLLFFIGLVIVRHRDLLGVTSIRFLESLLLCFCEAIVHFKNNRQQKPNTQIQSPNHSTISSRPLGNVVR